VTDTAKHKGRDSYHDDFRLSITKALGDQLSLALTQLKPVELAAENLLSVEERPGVYQLYLDDDFVYVGKAEKTLRARLANHLLKISGRRNIDLENVKFSCLYVDEDFSALAPEQLLISHHKGMGSIPWNNNGFGNKDPGRHRDNTILKKSHFDVVYPIDIDLQVRGVRGGASTVQTFLKELKLALPFVFRYDEPPGSRSKQLIVPHSTLSADQAFRLLSEALGEPWQITALMGYVIMYAEAPREYKSAWRYYRSGTVVDVEPQASSEEIGLFGVDTD
jgi:hypothetical protein